MKQVKVHKDISCPNGSFKAGLVAEIDDAIAEGLIEAGHATLVGEIVEQPEAETADAAHEEETADASPTKLFRKKKK